MHVQPRIKVAILDTGIDIGHPSIKARIERIKDVRTWVNDLGGKQDRKTGDSSGHGTHIADLLLDVAPDSDIYIARIAKFSPTEPVQIAKAIDHAVAEWQVDIISMSFGFPDENDELSKAILNAHAHNILMFAAASNDGAHGLLPAFPARHHSVFCIYASDGMGNSIRGNPTARQHNYNFSTLGEAVNSAWPCNLSEKPWKVRKSGTSFSTPIAAGLAAVVLFYAQTIMPPEDSLKFKQYDKMRNMFHHMSVLRAGYNFLLPMSNYFDGKQKEEVIRAVMKGIASGSPVKA
ncbi:hypothetical protein VSDG_08918 [Cytospora chrysosperma]|uniref:Peptidase S8/S53 domain-containing protein n=1 Tax=Cytospora chrysosperma TaxID=252740 RepID=A0A423VD53_CYTCH|nr:hypothetical protein VSDG_08918 [Valsa sordida]